MLACSAYTTMAQATAQLSSQGGQALLGCLNVWQALEKALGMHVPQMLLALAGYGTLSTWIVLGGVARCSLECVSLLCSIAYDS